MKYVLTWNERPQGSPIEYENAQKRILEVFTQWKAPGQFQDRDVRHSRRRLGRIHAAGLRRAARDSQILLDAARVCIRGAAGGPGHGCGPGRAGGHHIPGRPQGPIIGPDRSAGASTGRYPGLATQGNYSMLARPEKACFLIADISGYTSYLAGVELDHAQDIIADLMDTCGEEPSSGLQDRQVRRRRGIPFRRRRQVRRFAASGLDRSRPTSRSASGSATSSRRRRASARRVTACRNSTSNSSRITANSSGREWRAATSLPGAT